MLHEPRFVDLAQTFHLPVVHLVDVPGFLIGRHAEEVGTISHGTRAMRVANFSVPSTLTGQMRGLLPLATSDSRPSTA